MGKSCSSSRKGRVDSPVVPSASDEAGKGNLVSTQQEQQPDGSMSQATDPTIEPTTEPGSEPGRDPSTDPFTDPGTDQPDEGGGDGSDDEEG